MIATVILVAALFTSSAANGPTGSQSYGGYSQHQQLQQQQYQPNQQQDRWYTEVNQASYVAQSSASAPESTTPPEDVEPSPLPEGWSEHLDPNSGQYYYYNAVDGTTSWDRPQAPETNEQGVDESGNNVEDSRPSEHKPESAGATDVAQNPTPVQERQETPENTVVGGINVMSEKSATPDASWQSNQNPQTKQPGPTQPSGIERQQTSWGGQAQSEHLQANEWGSTQPTQQHSGGKNWGQSNSTQSSVVGGEREVQKGEFQGQPPQTQPQEQGRSSGWGLPQPTKTDESPQKRVEPWGAPKSPEQRHQYHIDPREQIPPPVPSKETQPSSSDISPEIAWGMPEPAKNSPPDDRPQNADPPINQRQPWQEQRPTTGNQQRPPVQQDHLRLSPPQQPARPQYAQTQYPPQQHGSYNPNTPPGHGQPDPRYGGQNYYGRGYPPQQPPTGQLISQSNEDGTSAVKVALSSTWKGLLGFGNKTREVVGTAKDQVVTGATAASQTLSARSSSKFCQIHSVFICRDYYSHEKQSTHRFVSLCACLSACLCLC